MRRRWSFECTSEQLLWLDPGHSGGALYPAAAFARAGRRAPPTAGDFCIYEEGTGPAVGRFMDAVDAERLAIAGCLGVPAAPLVDVLCRAGFTTPEAARSGRAHDALRAGEPIRMVKAPPSLDHRYLHEDIGWGLVPWTALARAADVRTPTMDALIHLAGVANGVDYPSVGLTLDRMGLADLAPWRITAYVRTGS